MSSSTTTPYKFRSDKLNKEAFLQNTHWYDARGNLHELDSISPAYAQAILNFLRKYYGRYVVSSYPLIRKLKERGAR